jgi:tetrapyrrole methylase family protein / MazG family protein
MSRIRSRQRNGKRPRKAKRAPRKNARSHIEVSPRDRAAGAWFAKLMALQSRLRAPKGCPWDREQTHESLRKFLVEETYEALDAMDSGDPRQFASELGDVLLQVVFHAVLAEEAGRFTASDVIEAVHTKMVRRHPHVFGDAQAKTSAAVLKNWEQIKAEERAAEKIEGRGREAVERGGKSSDESILSGVPRSLPAVLEAYQLTRRAARIGFDWENLAGVMDKLDEEKREIESALPADGSKAEVTPLLEEEVGDLLFVGVNVARFLGVDPEIALKKANRKFKKRFEWMEAAARKEGRRLADLPRERMEGLWNESKVEENSRARALPGMATQGTK